MASSLMCVRAPVRRASGRAVRSAVVAPSSSVCVGRRYVRGVGVLATPERVQAALDAALKNAEECVGDCAVEWDTVEELSAAASRAEPQPASDASAALPEADAAKMQMVAEAIKEMQSAATPTIDTVRMLESAAAEARKVTPKAKEADPRVAKLQQQVEEALEAAKACVGQDDCATDWDTVEELSAKLSDLKK